MFNSQICFRNEQIIIIQTRLLKTVKGHLCITVTLIDLKGDRYTQVSLYKKINKRSYLCIH